MRLSTVASTLALGSSVLAIEPSLTTRSSVSKTKRSLPAISIQGNAFWADGKRFYVRGIDYQPGGAAENADPLANVKVCTRDIAQFKTLGVNTVRVYSLDSTLNHDECMDLLAEAGIYLMADVNSPKYSINREHPAPSYNADYLQAVFALVEEFDKYEHTMLFFSGNEVINDVNSTGTAPYVKATTRDIKNYLRSRGLRTVPVGYSAADVAENRKQTADYFNCGDDDTARSDFFAFNDYSWCNTDFLTAGWDQKVKNFTDYGIPIFLSEFGCITNGERRFGEIESLMHANMTSVYSGGMMYEYTSEENKYGIVTVDGDSPDVEETNEFTNLASAYSRWPQPTDDGNPRHATTSSVACPTQDSNWEVNPTRLPLLPSRAEAMLKDGAGEGPGLKGDGSQSGDGTELLYSDGTTGSDADGGSGSGSGGGTQDSNDNGSAASGIHFERGALVLTGFTVLVTLFGSLLL